MALDAQSRTFMQEKSLVISSVNFMTGATPAFGDGAVDLGLVQARGDAGMALDAQNGWSIEQQHFISPGMRIVTSAAIRRAGRGVIDFRCHLIRDLGMAFDAHCALVHLRCRSVDGCDSDSGQDAEDPERVLEVGHSASPLESR